MLNLPAFVVLDNAAAEAARRVSAGFPGSEVHGLMSRVDGFLDASFSNAVDHLQILFRSGKPIVGFCASGILIRAVAPLLGDKTKDSPVVAVSRNCESVIPLLGGHHGANTLAFDVANILHGSVILTTSGNAKLGIALDDPPTGWVVANPEVAKRIMADILANQAVSLNVESGDASWLTDTGALLISSDAPTGILITHKLIEGNELTLVLHPPVLALGVGCERSVDPEELIELISQTLRDACLAPNAVACLVSIDLKADEAAVHAAANHFGVQARFFSVEELEKQTPRLQNPSSRVFEEIGCHGVAEGAALASVGATGQLIVPKVKSARATCAVAQAPSALDPSTIGRPQGALSVVGIGPGMSDWRTSQATRALIEADDIVGYGLYLYLIEDLIRDKRLHQSELTEEKTRVRLALNLATQGKRVALVCSGDAGIYALASLVFELLDCENRADWNRINITVCPGVSAMQAAAARIGAPIGHDFCAISLSDLLTPWDVIKQRLKGAALGDFVIALYNPVSKKRRKQIIKARNILLNYRSAETPVVLACNLGREGERISIIRLDELGPDKADMLTLVLIGNSQSSTLKRGENKWVYTPRGYRFKSDFLSNDSAISNQNGDEADNGT